MSLIFFHSLVRFDSSLSPSFVNSVKITGTDSLVICTICTSLQLCSSRSSGEEGSLFIYADSICVSVSVDADREKKGRRDGRAQKLCVALLLMSRNICGTIYY